MSCGETKQILMDLALGEAGPIERKRAQEHLEACEACRAQLDDLNLARKLLVDGVPQEEVPRRITFVAAPEAGPLGWLRRRAFAIPLGAAAAVALLVGALALARTRVTLEQGRWEIAFGARDSGAPARPAGVPAALPAAVPPGGMTRAEAAQLIAVALQRSEARQRAETAALVETATARQDRRYMSAMSALAEQVRFFQQTQNILYKRADTTDLALERVASRVPGDRGDRQ